LSATGAVGQDRTVDDEGAARLLMIGDVARRSGCSVATLRFYEERGLLYSERGVGNRRWYPRNVLRRLAFIAAAQRLGLSLAEIAAALATLPADRPPGPKDWSRLSAPWAARVDRAIGELQALRRSLDSCIGCGCLSMDDCDLVNPGDEAAAEGEGSRWLRNVIRYR
jgi:MerR family redox-sensitive transcriptional activator SoxR